MKIKFMILLPFKEIHRCDGYCLERPPAVISIKLKADKFLGIAKTALNLKNVSLKIYHPTTGKRTPCFKASTYSKEPCDTCEKQFEFLQE